MSLAGRTISLEQISRGGIGVVYRATDTRLNRVGNTVGTVDYRTDIVSFGIRLFEMCSNTLPFKGQSGIDKMRAILHSAPPLHLHGLVPPQAVAGELQRIIEKCLAKDPDGELDRDKVQDALKKVQ